MEEGGDGAGERWAAALAEREAAEAEAAAAVAKVARKSKKYSDGSSRAGALAHARYELRKEADDLQKAVSMLSGVKSKKKSKRKLTAHLKDLHQG